MCDGIMFESGGFIVIAALIVLIVLAVAFMLKCIDYRYCFHREHKDVKEEDAASKERFTMPDDASFWTFNVKYRPLDADEYTKIYSAGWELISCTTENESYYPNCGPEAPRMERTVWHYAFHKKPEVL